MGMAEKIIANAASFLEPGEQVHGAFAGQKTLTNRLLTTAPRGQRLGGGSGLWHEVTLDGLTMKVNRRYFTQLQAIDQAGSHA